MKLKILFLVCFFCIPLFVNAENYSDCTKIGDENDLYSYGYTIKNSGETLNRDECISSSLGDFNFVDGSEIPGSGITLDSTNECYGSKCALIESSCEKSKYFEQSIVSGKYHYCKNGCKDGACIKDDNLSTQLPPTISQDTWENAVNNIQECNIGSINQSETTLGNLTTEIIDGTKDNCTIRVNINTFLGVDSLKNKSLICTINPKDYVIDSVFYLENMIYQNKCSGDFIAPFLDNIIYLSESDIDMTAKSECGGVGCFNKKLQTCSKSKIDLKIGIPDMPFGSSATYNQNNGVISSISILGKDKLGCIVNSKTYITGEIKKSKEFNDVISFIYPEAANDIEAYCIASKNSSVFKIVKGDEKCFSKIVYDELKLNSKTDTNFAKKYSGSMLIQKENNSLWYVNKKDNKRYSIKTIDDIKRIITPRIKKDYIIKESDFKKYAKSIFPTKYRGNFVQQENDIFYINYIDQKGKYYSINLLFGESDFIKLFKNSEIVLTSKNIRKIPVGY